MCLYMLSPKLRQNQHIIFLWTWEWNLRANILQITKRVKNLLKTFFYLKSLFFCLAYLLCTASGIIITVADADVFCTRKINLFSYFCVLLSNAKQEFKQTKNIHEQHRYKAISIIKLSTCTQFEYNTYSVVLRV